MTGPETAATARVADLRLARLHLRTGAHGLARAELESFVGSGDLDVDGLVDLAEARWRTGDLAGAGDAALASLEQGPEDPLALVIAAEATVAAGQAMRALELAERARAILSVDLDVLFAGMPHSSIWPVEEPASPGGPTTGSPGGSETSMTPTGWSAASPIVEAASDAGGPAGALEDEATRIGGAGPAAEPDVELAAARAEIAAGQLDRAGLRLGLIVRRDPERADEVASMLAGRREAGLLTALGDAHRALGDEPAARAAWAAASAALAETAGSAVASDATDPRSPTGGEAIDPAKEST